MLYFLSWAPWKTAVLIGFPNKICVYVYVHDSIHQMELMGCRECHTDYKVVFQEMQAEHTW